MDHFIQLSNFSKIVPYAQMFEQGVVVTILLSLFTVLIGFVLALLLALCWRIISYYIYLIIGICVIPSWLRQWKRKRQKAKSNGINGQETMQHPR